MAVVHPRRHRTEESQNKTTDGARAVWLLFAFLRRVLWIRHRSLHKNPHRMRRIARQGVRYSKRNKSLSLVRCDSHHAFRNISGKQAQAAAQRPPALPAKLANRAPVPQEPGVRQFPKALSRGSNQKVRVAICKLPGPIHARIGAKRRHRGRRRRREQESAQT